jgi:hypothetical protein
MRNAPEISPKSMIGKMPGKTACLDKNQHIFSDAKINKNILEALTRQFSYPPEKIINEISPPEELSKTKIDILLPRTLSAYNITKHLRASSSDTAQTNIKFLPPKTKIYCLNIGFGVQPDPNKIIDSIQSKIVLFPNEIDGKALKIFDFAPQTSFAKKAEFKGEIGVNSDLKFATPTSVPWLNVNVGASADIIYKTECKFAAAVITAASNYNDVVSWSFDENPESGEDPRGDFKTNICLGVPDEFFKSLKTGEHLKANLTIKASRKGWRYRNREAEARNIPIELI